MGQTSTPSDPGLPRGGTRPARRQRRNRSILIALAVVVMGASTTLAPQFQKDAAAIDDDTALVLFSQTIDMALLITSKAVTVVITALLGFVAGHMVYLQLTEGTALALQPMTPVFIALAAFLVLSTALSVQSLRRLGNLRFVVAAGLVVLGPMLLVWL
jgi:hypothetical protein